MDQIFVQYRFTIQKDGLSFTDAIILPQAAYNALSQKEIDDIKVQRFVAWKQQITNPPIQPEPPVEEKLAAIVDQIEDLIQQKELLESQLEDK